MRSRSRTKKFCVKVFGYFNLCLYLLDMSMDQVGALHVRRLWSEVLCCTIMTKLSDLEFKVTHVDILSQSFCLKCFELYIAD